MFVYDIFGKDEDVVVGGLAVDIGTTTVSAVLINMETGEILAKVPPETDRSVLARMLSTVSLNQQKPGGKKKLQDAVIKETINPMIHRCAKAGIPAKQIYRMSCGIKYNDESSVCRNQCGSGPYGAVYSGIL